MGTKRQGHGVGEDGRSRPREDRPPTNRQHVLSPFGRAVCFFFPSAGRFFYFTPAEGKKKDKCRPFIGRCPHQRALFGPWVAGDACLLSADEADERTTAAAKGIGKGVLLSWSSLCLSSVVC